MDNFPQTIRKAYEVYDENSYNNKDMFKKYKYYSLSDDKKKILFFDKNKQFVANVGFEVIGKIYHSDHIWTWGWSDASRNKDLVVTSRKLLNYALDLDNVDLNMKTMLITSRSRILSHIQLNIMISLAAYLSKQQYVYKLDIYGSDIGKNIKIKYDGREYNSNEVTKSHEIPYTSFFLALKYQKNG